jgi:hypothetical protein
MSNILEHLLARSAVFPLLALGPWISRPMMVAASREVRGRGGGLWWKAWYIFVEDRILLEKFSKALIDKESL